MTKAQEALKLALEALESMAGTILELGEQTTFNEDQAITAIKEALAQTSTQCEKQPAQEPVAWTVSGKITDWSKDFSAYQTKHYTRPVYTPSAAQPAQGLNTISTEELIYAAGVYDGKKQRPWVGLTDEEASWCQVPSTIQTWKRIENKLKEKNT